MIEQHNGGPAFPCEWDYIDTNRSAANGMTLRDYFAAKAMQGICASGAIDRLSFEDISNAAFEFADAMIERRKK